MQIAKPNNRNAALESDSHGAALKDPDPEDLCLARLMMQHPAVC